jgi:hypothetical protein
LSILSSAAASVIEWLFQVLQIKNR